MLRRDYIQRMIEEYARVIAYALGLKQHGREEEAREELRNGWTVYFNEDPELITALAPSQLLKRLAEHHNLTLAQIEIFAEGLRTEGDLYVNTNGAFAKDRYIKALSLYEYVELNDSSSFSIPRRNAIEELVHCIPAL
jgi:HSP90 family molecular chaperone